MDIILLPNNQGAAVIISRAEHPSLTLAQAATIVKEERDGLTVTEIFADGPDWIVCVTSDADPIGPPVDLPPATPKKYNQPVCENPNGWNFTNDNDPDSLIDRHGYGNKTRS
jgi:hypothetical protein